MMKAVRLIPILLFTVVVWACSSNESGTARTPTASSGVGGSQAVAGQGGGGSLAATMQFGQADVGSPFPPGSGHDQSAHARDNIVPGTVVIGQGGTVTFNVPAGVHQIAIYNAGTQPSDIDITNVTSLAAFAGCAGPPVVNAPLVINDANNRLATIPVSCFAPATKTYTFTSPGKYLVICAFSPHFQVGMYGWVVVKD